MLFVGDMFASVKYVNEMLQAASNIADAYAEPHPLWEYPAQPLSATFDLLHVNLGKSLHGIKSLERSGSVELTRSDHSCLSLLIDTKKAKGSPYSSAERRVPELIPVLDSQPAGDVSHKPGGSLPLLSTRPAVTLATPKRAATSFAVW